MFIASKSDIPLYEITTDGEILSHAVEFPDELVDIKIVFAPDGTLFATAPDAIGQMEGPVTKIYVMRINVDEGTTDVIYDWEHIGTSGGSTAIATDTDGNIWLHTNGDIDWYAVIRISEDGQVDKMVSMDGIGIDAGGLAISMNDDIFVAGPNGIFRVYQEK